MGMLREMVFRQKSDAAIAVLGLAYKENTHSTRNSPSLLLIEHLTSCKVIAYDPAVPASSTGLNISGAASALEAVTGADAVVIMTPWPEFKAIDPAEIRSRMNGRVVIDPYRMLNIEAVKKAGLAYAALGMEPTLR